METVAQETTAAAAVAGIASNIATVQTHVGAFDKIAAGLAELEKRHPKDVLIAEIGTTAGMKSAVAARAAWRAPRLAVEKARKDAKAPVLALGKAIDAFAGDLTAKLLEGEQNYDAQIKAEEQRKEAEKAAKAAAEAARVQRHQERVAEIRGAVAAAVRCTAAQIAEHIADIERMQIDDSFEEYRGKAEEAKADALQQLRDLHAAVAEREAEAARLAAEREELARLRAEQQQREQEAAAARAEEERKAREAKEAAARAEAERLAAERRAHEETLRAEREAHEAEMARQRATLAEQERQAAAARAEADRIAREAREAAEAKAAAELAEAQRVAREAAAARQREEEAHAAAEKRLRDAAPVMLAALHHAKDWISAAPHGDNCFVSAHYEGDPGDRCNCGKDAALQAVIDAIDAAEPATA